MRDLAPELRALCASGRRFALATVVRASGSTPRPVGTVMAVTADGEAIGSLSGGCVESAVYALAEQVLADGLPVQETYGISDDEAFSVGLTCGGVLEVLVREADPVLLLALLDRVEADEPVALVTVLGGDARQLLVGEADVVGSLGNEGLDVAATADARGMLAAAQTGLRHYGPRGQRRVDDVAVLVQALTPPPRMLVYGATDFARALTGMGRFLGYRITLCDARPVFATPRRFPDAHEVVNAWPHDHLADQVRLGRVDARTVVAVLTHDPKFDVPLLREALRSPAGYVGAMGSRRTHDDRLATLRATGVTEVELSRLRSPIGLDIGGRTAEETAVSIAAELVQHRWGGTGQPLSRTDGTIHWSLQHGADLPDGATLVP